MGSREASGDRGSGGGAAAEDGSSCQDSVHLPMPHRCLLLGGQGTYVWIDWLIEVVLWLIN